MAEMHAPNIEAQILVWPDRRSNARKTQPRKKQRVGDAPRRRSHTVERDRPSAAGSRERERELEPTPATVRLQSDSLETQSTDVSFPPIKGKSTKRRNKKVPRQADRTKPSHARARPARPGGARYCPSSTPFYPT
ncbi:hypothetical protein Taro_033250 [Colocasia esculenta]|uniref:Uncharacterized protein n=1 Tax=Colocasia esculenta TaxID=4460 RepID=A0A843VNC2_COLES|nr:hypothetical protein [Colocasia esculenta]